MGSPLEEITWGLPLGTGSDYRWKKAGVDRWKKLGGTVGRSAFGKKKGIPLG